MDLSWRLYPRHAPSLSSCNDSKLDKLNSSYKSNRRFLVGLHTRGASADFATGRDALA